MEKPIRIVPYDARWPEAFRREEGRLSALIGPAALAIHHIGSTAVPGLCSKPVVDVLVEAADLAWVDQLEPEFVSAGFVPKGEYGIAGRRYFSRPEGRELKTHVHVFQKGDPAVARHLLFRDLLRGEPGVADDYCALKLELAHEHGGDAEAYQNGKAAFISSVELLAVRQ